MPHYMQVYVRVFSLNFVTIYSTCVGGLAAYYSSEQFLCPFAFECM